MKHTKKEVEEFLDYLKTELPELRNLKLVTGDSRVGGLVGLVELNENGGYDIQSEFMECNEMYFFLQGYKEKAFNRYK